MEPPLVLSLAVGVAGILLVGLVFRDTFETIILPRGVTRGAGLTRLYYAAAWRVWLWLAKLAGSRREGLLSLFGPFSLPTLLFVWALLLILGFAMMGWGFASLDSGHQLTFMEELYMSGTSFFTLGIGDLAPTTPFSRALVVFESGVGFGFLALVLSYLPVLYGAFIRRETHITLLDARMGTPPSAGEFLRRCGHSGGLNELSIALRQWETWSSDLLESHLSYPVLTYYRSQHERQSWLAALTAVMDTCALVMVGVGKVNSWQAQLTFAMARHCVVDVCMVLGVKPVSPDGARLDREQSAELRAALTAAGLPLREGEEADAELTSLRRQYEPFLESLSNYLCLPLPEWLPKEALRDNWQTSIWDAHRHL